MQDKRKLLDRAVHAQLLRWPDKLPGLPRFRVKDAWLRGRPCAMPRKRYPYLKFPGSTALRTMPDGLWLNFGGSPAEPFADIVVVEACASMGNLLDKRSRFAPSTQSLLAVCPLEWLLARITEEEDLPRWRATGVLNVAPCTALTLPVRDVRVLYALRQMDYRGFALNLVPHPHEFFLPMETLVADDSLEDPALQALLARASMAANFMTEPS